MPETRHYNKSSCAFFCRVNDPFGELSNLHKAFRLQLGDQSITSTENLYHALRFPDHPELQERVLNEPRAMGSKILTYQPDHIKLTRSDWMNGANVRAMRACLRLKTWQHQERILAVLSQTNGQPIVELSKKDNFWGAIPARNGQLVGCNVLGRLWMEVLDMTTKRPAKEWLLTPSPDDLILLGRPLLSWFTEVLDQQ